MQPFFYNPGQVMSAANWPFTITNVQKLAAYILLAVFIVLQFAKQVSYAECRLANYLSTSGQPCDCEKIFAEKTGLEKSTELPLNHRHLHIDDLYSFTSLVSAGGWKTPGIADYSSTDVNKWINAIAGTIDRPPSGNGFSSILL